MPKPFIKKFTQEGNHYIYDVNTNQIVEVGNEKVSPDEIAEAQKQQGLFSTFRPEKILLGLRSAQDIKEFHNKNAEQLLLELSTGCNLGCSYCPVAGTYKATEYEITDMSRDILRKSVDFFYQNSLNTDAPCISFYGGEPLTRFTLIKETVGYVKQKHGGHRYKYNLTTNGTLINKDALDFLEEHDFFVNVSLDGPEHVHDRYRLTRKGNGSFRTIMKNLKFMKESYNDYYSKNVAISCVLAPPFDEIEEILDFFSSEELFTELRVNEKIKASGLDTGGTVFIDKNGLHEQMKQSDKVYDLLNQRYKEAILSGNLSYITIENRPMEPLLYNIARRPFNRLYPQMQPLGACHIGLKRIFVKTNGDFHVCERSGNDYKIGHADNGFDYEQIASYYRKLEDVLSHCKNCWALLYCERCWVSLGNLKEFKGKVKEQFCHSRRNFIEKAFKLYVSLLREDPECLKVLKNAD